MEELLKKILATLERIEAQGGKVATTAPTPPAETERVEFGREFQTMLNAPDLMAAIDSHNRREREKRKRRAA